MFNVAEKIGPIWLDAFKFGVCLTILLFQSSLQVLDHQKANDKTIILSTENVQKVHSRPKLRRFEKKKANINILMPFFGSPFLWCYRGTAEEERLKVSLKEFQS